MKVGFQCNGQGTGKCMYVISKQWDHRRHTCPRSANLNKRCSV